jgi:rhodanese-related sulfurtransferase
LRPGVRKLVTPDYPQVSLGAGIHGVAVAQVRIAVDGHVNSVTILQAPDERIRTAVAQALAQWMFGPITLSDTKEPLEVTGKLTYYFVLAQGKGRVLSPEEMRTFLQLSKATPGPPVQDIDEPGLAAALKKPRTVLLDPSDREDFARNHRPGALNIPSSELSSRARNEINPGSTVILDCTSLSLTLCRAAGRELQKYGFTCLFLSR